eukprot:TRINITY_DN1358_c0_g1_i1.p1 TRINITY_DN1358_c0_g1~~TRINITY_DN1358_c0_g1_i1.p1  ORF type:complete len:499 (-),score=35.52 TRINITY_DN1358_c0_g1_i1:373-1746(-)
MSDAVVSAISARSPHARTITFVHGIHNYCIDFVQMKQTNLDTRTVRDIRFVEPSRANGSTNSPLGAAHGRVLARSGDELLTTTAARMPSLYRPQYKISPYKRRCLHSDRDDASDTDVDARVADVATGVVDAVAPAAAGGTPAGSADNTRPVVDFSTLNFQAGNMAILGRGAHGTVKHARVDYGGVYTPIALKTIVLTDDTRLPAIRERDAYQRLRHPYLLELLGWREHDDGAGTAVLQMALEYIPGNSLFSWVGNPGQAQDAARQRNEIGRRAAACVVRALRYMHSERLVHRDVKPGNMMWVDASSLPCPLYPANPEEGLDAPAAGPGRDCAVKLGDFGTVRDVSPMNTDIGTLAYMSPEDVRCEPADVWSLGVSMSHYLRGELPWAGTSHRAVFEEWATMKRTNSPPERATRGLFPWAADFVRKCMTVDPDLRPTCDQLLHHPWLKREMPPPDGTF